MRPLDEAMARVEAQLAFIPTTSLRQMRILALINEQTASDRTWIQLNDDLGRFAGGVLWPLISPFYWKKMTELGPAFAALELCNDLHLHHWDGRPGVAFEIPETLYHNSLLYRFIYGQMNSHHAALCGYPARGDGSQVIVIPVRGRERQAYASADLRILEEICAHFATELSAANPVGLLRPRHAVTGEQGIELDAQLRSPGMPLNTQALLAFFYGDICPPGDDRISLPSSLVADILRYRDDKLRPIDPVEEAFQHAFTKHRLGRILCLILHVRPDGTMRLDLHEDHSQHERLRRLKAACRVLPRDRTSVFTVCLVLAEGVRAHGEIVRRANLTAHKPASALRLINRARRIVAMS